MTIEPENYYGRFRHIMSETGWTCTMHEPEPCGDCQTIYDQTATAMLVMFGSSDTHLKAIADAWNAGLPKYWLSDIRKEEMRANWPELADLLDASTKWVGCE